LREPGVFLPLKLFIMNRSLSYSKPNARAQERIPLATKI
jgi:hypothetical protein